MNEQEWLESSDPERMLAFLYDRKSINIIERKLRFFECGCVRRVWHQLTDRRIRGAVEVAERFADRRADVEEIEQAYSDALDASNEIREQIQKMDPEKLTLEILDRASVVDAAVFTAAGDLRNGITMVVRFLSNTVIGEASHPYSFAKLKEQSEVLRDIIGNPFRPATVDPAWLTREVKALTQAIYDERRFADMPILGDALVGAGCTEANILNHCRQPGEHVRGCWAVDLLLGKA